MASPDISKRREWDNHNDFSIGISVTSAPSATNALTSFAVRTPVFAAGADCC
jgi:hypothetical protein